MAKRKKGKSKGLSVNFKGVEARKLVAEGEYLITPVEVTQEQSSNDNSMLSWVFEVTEGTFKGSKLYYNTMLEPAKTLWVLKSLLEALGIEVPNGEMDLDLGDITSGEYVCGAEVLHDTYEGKKKAVIADFFSADDVEAVEDDEDEEESDTSEDEDEEDDFDEDEILEMDEDELEEVIDEYELDVDLEDFKGIKKQRKAVIEAYKSRDEEEDDDEDEEGYSTDDINQMKAKELKALVDKHELDVELEGKIRQKRKAVIEALEEEDLLTD